MANSPNSLFFRDRNKIKIGTSKEVNCDHTESTGQSRSLDPLMFVMLFVIIRLILLQIPWRESRQTEKRVSLAAFGVLEVLWPVQIMPW